jgi:ankyrin repeat protein/nucleoside phosphorylase
MSSLSQIEKRDCSPERADRAFKRMKLEDRNQGNETKSLRTLSREDYTVGWISALSLEEAAAMAMLDEIHGNAGQSKMDNNSYTFGSMAGHDCVIACLPAGVYGHTSATIVADQMRWSFPSIRFWLLVGIGGGAPTEKADIRLGDVVVSTPTARTHSPGVIQYDYGKMIRDGVFERTGVLDKPPPLLLNAISTLQAKHRTKGCSRLLELINEMTSKHPGMRARYGPRDPRSDVLFKADYDHEKRDNCQNCDRRFAVARAERQIDGPHVHYGTIGSANRVMRDGTVRDRLAKEIGILCFEMEAAGLVDNFECLTIRGICDYADSHKNNDWQEFAAATAAAYAKELLGVIPPRCSLISARDHRQQCLKALDFVRREKRQSTIGDAMSETCTWLLARPEYQKWLDSRLLHEHNGFLWIKGKAGTGKSTLMKFAFDNAKQETSNSGAIVISFFFNARGSELEKSATGMYRSLLFQLFTGLPRLQDILDSEVSSSMLESGSWSLEHLKHLLRRVIRTLKGQLLICFIDALDECCESEVRDMVDYFGDIGELAASRQIPLHVCLSSRHYPHVTFKKGLEMILEGQDGHGKDISRYLDHQLASIKHKEIPEVKAEIIEKASGIFSWVDLVVKILKKTYDHGQMRALRKRLREIPPELKELFKDILTRDNENMEDLLLCLQWTLYAKRPLSPHELFYAVQSHNKDELDLMERLADDDSVSRFILSCSKGLIEVTEESQKTVRKTGRKKVRKTVEVTIHKTAQFIHESVRDFLLKEGGLDQLWQDMHASRMVPGHEVLKVCCWNYLTKACIFKESRLPDDIPPARTRDAVALRVNTSKSLPFLDYAVNNVLQHAEAAEEADVSQTDFLSYFDTSQWTYMSNLFEKREAWRYTEGTRLIYILAERNLSHLLKTCLDAAPLQAIFHNCECRYCGSCEHPLGENPHRWASPFAAAVAMRNEQVIRVLLTTRCTPYALQGEDLADQISRLPKLKVPKDSTIFDHAMKAGDIPLLRLVLSTGRVDLSTARVGLSNPVKFAVEYGNYSLLMTVLEFGADLNEQMNGPAMNSLLGAAVKWNQADIVRLLLERGADPNEPIIADILVNSPLGAAIRMGAADTVRLLLEHGADPNKQLRGDPATNSPLGAAIGMGRADIVRLLLEHGADPNPRDCYRLPPLQEAFMLESTDIVQQLLSAGANVNFHLATCRPSVPFTRWLLEMGADINYQNIFGQTPLHGAETLEICEFLIDRGADLNIRDNMGRTPIFSLNYAKVQLLLSRGAEVNVKDITGYPAIVWLARLGDFGLDVIQLLLDNGANADGCRNIPALLSEMLRHRQHGRF